MPRHRKIPLHSEPPPSLRALNAQRFRTVEEQTARAREMVKAARAMTLRALEMRKPPRVVVSG